MNIAKLPLIKWFNLVVIAVLFGTGPVLAFSFPGFGSHGTVKATNGVVTIPAAQIADGKARFFEFDDAGKGLRFFVVKGSDGAYHVAFDACDACYREKKGYSQDGGFMVCRNCNMKFATNRIGKANNGGCNPSHLDFALAGGNVVVKVADLKSGARFF